MKKGLPLLSYHKWLVSTEQRMKYDPSYVNPSSYYVATTGFGMQPMPPPVYNPNAPLPPSYQPQNGSKVDPSQWGSAVPPPQNANYQAPPGPPPTAVRPDQAGGR